MLSPLDIAILALLPVGFVQTLYWGTALFRVVRTRTTIPTLRRGLELPAIDGPAQPLCVIIPAHNEAELIADLIGSLKKQDYPNLAFVLSLDRCTDQTEANARAAIGDDPRFEIVVIDQCPDDWTGKCHAIWSATKASERARSCELLLCLDADTVLDPACIRAAVALQRERDVDLLSLLSTLTIEHPFERWIQPAAALELMYQYPLERANRPAGARRAFANGQFMLFRAEIYRAVDGHKAVHDKLFEDVWFARELTARGNSIGVFLADRLLVCKMYDSYAAFKNGWLRILTEAAKRKRGRLSKHKWRKRIAGAILPMATAALLATSGVGVVTDPNGLAWIGVGVAGLGSAVFLASLWLIYRIAGVPIRYVPGYVIGAWVVAGILGECERRLRQKRPIEWGQKQYAVEER